MVYETGEVVSLSIALIGYFILIIEFKHNKNLVHLFLAYTLLLAGAIATVAEGFYFRDIFNFIEHSVGAAMAGLLFSINAILANRKIAALEKVARKMVSKK